MPDAASRKNLLEYPSLRYVEKYADYIALGVEEWRKTYQEYSKVNKKSVLFIMTDDTKDCDEVAQYLAEKYPEFQAKNSVLVIHTKNNGEISESNKDEEELRKLRKAANSIDSKDSPYLAIVSVLMLKEGWDVRNVTTIIGLRSYSAKSNILPEQTLGRGLRRMFSENELYLLATNREKKFAESKFKDSQDEKVQNISVVEEVSVIGTPSFMEFIESIQNEGVMLEYKEMNLKTPAHGPMIIQIDKNKNVDQLDIEIPLSSFRLYREYKNLENLDITKLANPTLEFSCNKEANSQIVFRDLTNDYISHTIEFQSSPLDSRSILSYFTSKIIEECKLVGNYDSIYPKVKEFTLQILFGQKIELENPKLAKVLMTTPVQKTIIETFSHAIRELTIQDQGNVKIEKIIRLQDTQSFVVQNQLYRIPKKCLFNKIIGDSHLELLFSDSLESFEDVVAYSKIYPKIGFSLDYIDDNQKIAHYFPDFFVTTTNNILYIVEVKGREDLDVPLKMARLQQWCQDVQQLYLNKTSKYCGFDFLFVEEENYRKYPAKSFKELILMSTKYKQKHK